MNWKKRVDSGEMAVAFALHPVTMEELLAVADAGKIMPPKSLGLSQSSVVDCLFMNFLDIYNFSQRKTENPK